MRKLDLLYVGTLPPHPGGSAISCSQLLTGLARKGHSVRALAPITAETIEQGIVFDTAHPELNAQRYLVPRYDTTPNLPAGAEYRAHEWQGIQAWGSREIERRQPDMILAGRETFARFVPELAAASQLPWVLWVRGNPTHGLIDGTYERRASVEMLERFRAANLVICVAAHLATGLGRLGVTSAITIPGAVDIELFAPRPKPAARRRQFGIQEEALVAAIGGRLQPRKRVLDFTRAVCAVMAEGPPVIALVIGDGAQRDEISKLAAQYGMAERFFYTGWIGYSEMPEVLGLADAVVSASEAEGMSRMYLETMACGRVLIASDIAAARELIHDGESGFLFPLGEVDALATLLRRVLGDAVLRGKVGARARAEVEQYSMENAVERYQEALLRVTQVD